MIRRTLDGFQVAPNKHISIRMVSRMYSPYRRWNGCLGAIGAFAIMAVFFFSWATGASGPVLLIAAICFLWAIVGLVRLAFRPRLERLHLSALPVVIIAIGSIMATVGIMFVVGGTADLGRDVAMIGVALAILGFFLDERSKMR